MTVSIQDIGGGSKRPGGKKFGPGVFYQLLIIVVAIVAFGLGRLSVMPESGGAPDKLPPPSTPAAITPNIPATTRNTARDTTPNTAPGSVAKVYVASKNSDKYHLPSCSGAKRIKEENKVWFSSQAEAEASGYIPAANCPGI